MHQGTILPRLSRRPPPLEHIHTTLGQPFWEDYSPLFFFFFFHIPGTLLPTCFLLVIYLNSEARKVGDFTQE